MPQGADRFGGGGTVSGFVVFKMVTDQGSRFVAQDCGVERVIGTWIDHKTQRRPPRGRLDSLPLDDDPHVAAVAKALGVKL
jgi:hypothetical protein